MDVTIQAQVLLMMKQLRQQLGTSMILITHDLGVVSKVCDSVAVIYAGEIVEYGTLRMFFLEIPIIRYGRAVRIHSKSYGKDTQASADRRFDAGSDHKGRGMSVLQTAVHMYKSGAEKEAPEVFVRGTHKVKMSSVQEGENHG